MKSPLLAGVTALTFVALTATTLYAQVAGGTSIIDKMKAVAHSFTLAATLNPSDSGLTSDPIKGKKTGDILTAGEYNRLLELVGEGGSNSLELWKCTCGGYMNMVTTSNLTFGETCIFGNGGTAGNVQYSSWSCTKLPNSGGGGSVGAGWVDVPLIGGDNFDDQCMYRFKLSSSTLYNYTEVVGTDAIYWYADGTRNIYVAKGDKTILADSASTNRTVTKIEKFCGGSSGSSGGTFGTAWVNFDGTQSTIAMKGASGIASVTKVSAGNYQVNFTTPRADTDYGVICTSGPSPAYLCFPHSKTTTGVLIKTSNPTTNVDAAYVSLVIQ